MSASLIESLQAVEDFRGLRGRRYPLWLILLLAILGTVSGCYGYCALEEFCVRHYAALCEQLGVTVKRWPSDTTFRIVIALKQFENKRDSEIKVVQTLLKTLGLEDVVFTLDALHAQKKPCS